MKLENVSYEQQIIDHFEFDYKSVSYSVDFVNGNIEFELSQHF